MLIDVLDQTSFSKKKSRVFNQSINKKKAENLVFIFFNFFIIFYFISHSTLTLVPDDVDV